MTNLSNYMCYLRLAFCYITVTAALFIGTSACKAQPPKAKFTLKIIDEAGKPFPGANVKFNFEDPRNHQPIFVTGQSDANGGFIAESICDGWFGLSITKDGYYRSGAPFKGFTGIEDNRWLPWNPTLITTMRPIGKPIALYAKRGWINLPAENVSCGYDLELGDWVAPYGKGSTSDLIFTLKRRFNNRRDFDASVNLEFKNASDGIQSVQWPESGKVSSLRWPREAPETGYAGNLRLSYSCDASGHKGNAPEDAGYFVRVRSVEQDGKLVSANYAKISQGLQLAPEYSKTCKVYLSYYYNPTSLDRNLEWDLKKNLFHGLNIESTPQLP